MPLACQQRSVYDSLPRTGVMNRCKTGRVSDPGENNVYIRMTTTTATTTTILNLNLHYTTTPLLSVMLVMLSRVIGIQLKRLRNMSEPYTDK